MKDKDSNYDPEEERDQVQDMPDDYNPLKVRYNN